MAKPVQPSPSPPAPPPDADAPQLSDILDARAIQSMMDAFYALDEIGMAIVDLRGNVLVATGWQDVCTKFHRVHPETLRCCRESDVALSAGVAPGEFKLYRCRNNLWEMATPIVVGGRHVGNFFLGQFFFDDEPPDLESFRAQARQHGFDEQAYLAALERVPRWSRRKVERAMTFYSRLAQQISDLGYRNLQLTQALARQRQAEADLRASNRIVEGILHAIPARVFWKNRDLVYLGCNEAFARDAGFAAPADVVGKDDFQMAWRDQAEAYRADDRQVIDGGGAKMLIEEPQTTPDGKTLALLTSKIPLRDDHGAVVGVLGTYLDVTERKQAEAALRESEERCRSILNASPDDITIADLEGRILMASPSGAKMFAFKKADDLVGRQVLDFVVPEDRDQARDKIARLFHGNGPVSGEFRGLRANGTTFNLEVNAELIRSSAGTPLQMILIVRDVTGRKQTEEKLRANAERFQDIAANIPGVIYQLQAGRTGSFEVPYMSSGCEALFGRPVAGLDFTGLLFEHMHLGDRALFDHTLAAAARTLERWSLEFRIARPDGQTKWLRGSANPRKLPDGRILWTGVLLDIDDLKRAEDALRKSESFQRLLMDAIPSPVFYKDRHGCYLGFNQAFEKFFGKSKDQLIGKNVGEIAPPDLAALYHAKDMELIEKSGTQIYEAQLEDAAGVRHDVVYHKASIPGDHGAVAGIVGLFIDITERKQAEQRLAQQMEELRRWQTVTLGRENRVAELKREVNALAVRLGQPHPYPSAEETAP